MSMLFSFHTPAPLEASHCQLLQPVAGCKRERECVVGVAFSLTAASQPSKIEEQGTVLLSSTQDS